MSDFVDRLAAIEGQIDVRDQPSELLALVIEIEELGRELAGELMRVAAEPALAAPLKRALLQLPAVHTRALLRTAEKFDDAGSPRRAARVLIEALRRAFEANMIEVVANALAFTLEAFAQQPAAARLRALVIAPPAANRRETRERYLAGVDELVGLVDWAALDDELA